MAAPTIPRAVQSCHELLLEVAGKFSMSSLGCEHFLQDCKNGCEGTWCDSPNPSDQPFAIDCT